jgi:hypothetical protein
MRLHDGVFLHEDSMDSGNRTRMEYEQPEGYHRRFLEQGLRCYPLATYQIFLRAWKTNRTVLAVLAVLHTNLVGEYLDGLLPNNLVLLSVDFVEQPNYQRKHTQDLLKIHHPDGHDVHDAYSFW